MTILADINNESVSPGGLHWQDGAGRIGKPVEIRRSRATVTGEPLMLLETNIEEE